MTRSADESEISAAKDELVASLRRVVADAEELMSATSDEAGDALDELRKRMRDSLDVARGRMREAEASLRSNARQAAGTADDYVRENPWSALTAAAAVGLVLGVVLGRR